MFRYSFKPSRPLLFLPEDNSYRKKSHCIQFSKAPGDPVNKYSVEEFEKHLRHGLPAEPGI